VVLVIFAFPAKEPAYQILSINQLLEV